MTVYTYPATVLRVVDGDTIDLEVELKQARFVDLGFRVKVWEDAISFKDRFRLVDGDRGVDCPERGQVGWAEAASFVSAMLPLGKRVFIETQHPRVRDPRDSFGRWLATILVDDVSVGGALIENGLASEWRGAL